MGTYSRAHAGEMPPAYFPRARRTLSRYCQNSGRKYFDRSLLLTYVGGMLSSPVPNQISFCPSRHSRNVTETPRGCLVLGTPHHLSPTVLLQPALWLKRAGLRLALPCHQRNDSI